MVTWFGRSHPTTDKGTLEHDIERSLQAGKTNLRRAIPHTCNREIQNTKCA